MFYTIGQRHGLDIGGDKRFKPLPWYVVGKKLDENIVYVSQREDQYWLKSNKAIVRDINYIGYDKDTITSAKFRYRSRDSKVLDYKWIDENTLELYYEDTLAVTPGQACVFYNGDICLGGGEIDKVYYNDEIRGIE